MSGMVNTIEIGKIHPAFFKHSKLFSRFDKAINEKGEVKLRSPFFVLEYNFDSGVLSCDDKDVLLDFVDLISKNYGSGITRDEVFNSIDWGSLGQKWSILNIGVCVLTDNDSGWDGSPNSIWVDAELPGRLVDIHSQFWNRTMLFDAWKLDESDIKKLGGVVTLPNLTDALVLLKDDKEKHKQIENLIGSLI